MMPGCVCPRRSPACCVHSSREPDMRLRAPRLFRRRFAVFTWGSRDDDMAREMAFHLDAMTREYVRGGMAEDEAREAARRRFGSVLRLKEKGHDVRSVLAVEDIMRDVRHMGRGLRKNLGFTIAVVL